jgi:ribonuclease HII
LRQLTLLNQHYNLYKNQYSFIAGIDEVGRGPLVGAVVAAAVILPEKYKIDYLTDSKKITEKQRIIAYNQIKDQAVCYALGRAEASEIDSINILQASLLAMSRALGNLAIKADAVLIDGNKIPKDIQIPVTAVIKGDLYEDVISAASIIAKVTRDREMTQLDKTYPQYGFAQHKGYPTKQHITAIQIYGIIPQHRKSFGPVRELLTAC